MMSSAHTVEFDRAVLGRIALLLQAVDFNSQSCVRSRKIFASYQQKIADVLRATLEEKDFVCSFLFIVLFASFCFAGSFKKLLQYCEKEAEKF